MNKRMRITNLWAALLCVLLLAGALTSCGGKEGTASLPGPSAGEPPTPAPAGVGEEETALNEIPLPISAEPITLSFWFPIGPEQLGNMRDYNDSDAYQKLEELTNIHIEWVHPVAGTEQESFNLLFASGDMPDLLREYNYAAGPDMAVKDGYFLDLTGLAELYAPNYKKVVNSVPLLQKDTVTDSGLRWGFYYIYAEGRKGNSGPAVRKDFLDRVGMDVPVTYEDWYQVLTAFKQELGVEAPLYISSNGTCIFFLSSVICASSL